MHNVKCKITMKYLPLFLLFVLPAVGQTPQHTDIAALVGRMPKLPANTQEALSASQRPNPYQPYADELRGIMDKVQVLNPVSVRMQQKGVAMDAQFKADGVSTMSDEQKMAYARQKQLGGAGSDGRMAFAEKMKNPAFREKFQAMSPQEKMALMQQMGVTQAPATAPQTSNPMQGEMTAMMQDPAMRAKWQAMSPAERQAFIEERKKASRYDAARRPAAKPADTGGSFADMMDSPGPAQAAGAPIVTAIAKTQALQKALAELAQFTKQQADNQEQQTTQREQSRVKNQAEALAQQIREGMAEAKKQGKTGLNWVYTNPAQDQQILLSSSKQQQQIDNTTLTSASREWAAKQAQIKQLIADYQAAMQPINYGESLYNDDSQFQNLATLAGQQGAAIGALQTIVTVYEKLANRAVQTQQDLQNNSQPAISKRLLMQSDGG